LGIPPAGDAQAGVRPGVGVHQGLLNGTMASGDELHKKEYPLGGIKVFPRGCLFGRIKTPVVGY